MWPKPGTWKCRQSVWGTLEMSQIDGLPAWWWTTSQFSQPLTTMVCGLCIVITTITTMINHGMWSVYNVLLPFAYETVAQNSSKMGYSRIACLGIQYCGFSTIPIFQGLLAQFVAPWSKRCLGWELWGMVIPNMGMTIRKYVGIQSNFDHSWSYSCNVIYPILMIPNMKILDEISMF